MLDPLSEVSERRTKTQQIQQRLEQHFSQLNTLSDNMRNLELISTERSNITTDGKIECVHFDSLSEVAFFATKNEICSYSLLEKKIIKKSKIDGDGIIALEYLIDDDTVSVATSNGDLFEWRQVDGGVECVGTMESGITNMTWSPDQEIFVLTTGDEKLVLMSRDLDPFFETDLNPQEFGEAQLITVGWGKKETQFHGTEGKPTAADLKPKIADPILPWDDKRVRVSWSEDGQHFAVSSVDPPSGSRKIRVRSRDGALFSTNEVVQGLEDSLHWRPSGSLIASTQRRPNKHDVIFFEKNGLRHGEFTLPFKPKETKVVELCWNKSSEVLAIWLEDLESEGPDAEKQPKSYIQLWIRNNYHWYLKQEYQFSSIGLQVCQMCWDVESQLKLHVICTNGVYYQLLLKWTVMQSKESCVGVIDGSKLLLTPFAKAVVPPPMSFTQVSFESPVNQICFGKSPDSATVALSDGSMRTLKITITDMEKQIDVGKIEIVRSSASQDALGQDSLGVLHLSPWQGNSYLAVCLNNDYKEAVCHLVPNVDTPGKFQLRSVIPLNGKVITMAVDAEATCVAMEMQDGTIFTSEKDGETINVKPWVTPFGNTLRFPYPCESIAVCKVNHEDIVIGMTSHFRLFVNEKQVADNCTSFAVHEEFLVYTTHTHQLRCLRLDSLLKFVNSAGKEDLQGEDFTRSLERGSRIVSVVCKDTKVVLQMPRGNLETIHPRCLVISFLQKLLDKLEYKDAFSIMKRHRINLNLIYDHNPKLFVDNVDAFITNVKSEIDINLFLADLEKNDVTKTLYSTSYNNKTPSSDADESTNKIDKVCLAVRDSIEKIGTERFFLSLLTSYAKQSEPDLETVLIKIKKLKDKQLEASVTYEKALKHILYLTDVNDLYNVALGLYDFDIVLMIAEKSNKDPKEYLPFLNELKSYDSSYCKYKIDCHLKRYRKALSHIHTCGKSRFEEFLDFVVEHDLYKDALLLCKEKFEDYKRVSMLYGTYLVKKKIFYQAGIVFSRVACHEEAKDAFVACHDWRLAICEVEKLQYSHDQMIEFARNLAENLKEKKQWKDAACILEMYTKDHESAILAYLDGNFWQDALRLIYGCKRLDIIDTNLKPCLIEAYQHHCNTLLDSKTNFIKYKERLAAVRVMKEKEFIEFGDGPRDDIENDLFSETSSITGQSATSASSRGSRVSGHSSKSRRKHQRKKYSLKEGSRYEDFALMEALAEIVNLTDHLQDGASSLLQMLVLFSYDKEATELQKSIEELISLIKKSMNEIWKHTASVTQTQPAIGPQSTVNSILANMQSPKQIDPEHNQGDFSKNISVQGSVKALRNVFAASLRINSPKKDRANVSFFEPNDLKGPSDLPAPTKPVLRDNVAWKLTHLI